MLHTTIRRMIPLLLLSASASGYAGQIVIPSEKHYQCGNWIESRRQTGSQDEQVMKLWLWGYVSGYVTATPRGEELDLPSGATVAAWMDKYCRDEPLSTIVTGGAALVKYLMSKRRK
ncbi:hypothetical protein [Delftia tsuruhatensis]|uniref:hypothetical protein n=1 Tax=Delftia tsuruhatensis TaxID=180282 RepID=UPI001F461262|nr:hypothetical protein [Delftia tsuruhatensis]